MDVLEKWSGEFPKVVIIGDSIVRWASYEGYGPWPSKIAYELFKFNIDTNIRGISGSCTRHVRQSITKLFPPSYLKKVELIILNLGTNDAFDGVGNNSTPSEYAENIRAIVSYLESENFPVEKTLWMTPIEYDPIGANAWDCPNWFVVNRKPETLEIYDKVLRKVATELKLPLFDMLEYSKSWDPVTDLIYDGYHYSQIGAKYMVALLLPVIMSKLQQNISQETLNELKNLWHLNKFLN